MTPAALMTPAGQRLAGSSERVALARAARAAALATPGVLELDAGTPPLTVTRDNLELLVGVAVAASGGARYDITVRLVAALVPLPALAEQVRQAVTRATQAAGLADRVGTVFVQVADVRSSASVRSPVLGADGAGAA